MNDTKKFYELNDQFMFVHIREPEEIEKYIHRVKKYFGTEIFITSLLVLRRSIDDTTYGNTSDDNVENFGYNLIYSNDTTLEEAKDKFTNFFDQYIFSYLK